MAAQMEVKDIILVACVCPLFFLVGCAKDTFAKEKLLGENVLVDVTLKKIRHAKEVNDSYVYGKLTMEGRGKKLISANLDCIGLSSNRLSSERLYVDSVAHILTSSYQARDNKINVDVYWLFTELVQDDDLAQLEISINKKNKEWDRCITFE